MTRADAVAASARSSFEGRRMDSRLRGNDDSSVNAVIPAQAGIHESRGGRRTSIVLLHCNHRSPDSIVKALAGQPPMGLSDAKTGHEPTA